MTRLLGPGPVFSQISENRGLRQILPRRSPRRILSASIKNSQGRQLKYANLGGDNMASGTIALDRAPADYSIWRVILASSVGTMIEWYDFYIFGSLAAVLSPKFYPAGNDTIALIAYLSTFAVGVLVRSFGALFFGRIGDLVGRKYAFLVTLTIMGGATALIGFLPTFATAGWFAPITLLAIRVLQGLGLGGE